MKKIEFDIMVSARPDGKSPFPEKRKGYLHVLTGDGSDLVMIGIHKKGSRWQATELNTGYVCSPRTFKTRDEMVFELDNNLIVPRGGEAVMYHAALASEVRNHKAKRGSRFLNDELVYDETHNFIRERHGELV